MVSLIDADSVIFVIGYNFREHINNADAIIDAQVATDNYIETILTITQADSYIGSFSSDKCFRNEVYKVAPYKGTRPEKADWVKYWQPIIKKRLIEKWNFYQPEEVYIIGEGIDRESIPGVEADDVICAMAKMYGIQDCIICSPDKDMRQIEGHHYDYKKENSVPIYVSEKEAVVNFWMQMLCGDDVDNLKGVPGVGSVKAKKLLDACNDPIEFGTQVMQQYCKYYGSHYGPIIFRETRDTVQLLSSRHSLWDDYRDILFAVHKKHEMPWVPRSEQASPFQQDVPGVGGTTFQMVFGR